MPAKEQLSHPVYVAVSMGVDSVAAFYYLYSKGYHVKALHFNHGMRPQNNEMCIRFREMMRDTEISSYRYEIGFGSGLKTEDDCRKARLDFFKKLNKDTEQNKTIITAHHLDDCEESYLLNCFRGHPEYKPMNLISDFGSFKIIHPFLLTEKKDFIQFVDKYKNGILKKYIVKDETNDVIKGSRRNWIRNVIVPEMQAAKISLKKHCKELINNSIKDISYGC
jgi:tRNA(Ile)-lysidine synthetase-like protein